MTWSAYLPFLLATLLISLSPGPGALAAMGAGLGQGFARGQAIAFGLLLGVCTQTAVVGAGLGAVLATSETAFTLVKWVGAAYLVWLGVQQWRAPAQALHATGDVATLSRTALVLRGWGVNALNPKGTVFLLAVLPQFIDASAALLPQYLTIGATFGLVECLVMTGYVALASRLQVLLHSPSRLRLMNRTMGSLFMAAGTALALFKRS
jgi:homoserine/homoserine lactone efflux protein